MPRRRALAALAFIPILVVAVGFRAYALNWDQGQWIHPDERMILMVVNNRLSLPTADQLGLLLTPQSPLNPEFQAYGSVPLYLLKAVQLITGNEFPLHLAARYISILFDVGTIVVAYALTASLMGAWWGLLAALMLAISPMHIQLAHYYTVDTMLAFWVVLGAWMGVRLAKTGARRWIVGLAVLTGVAAATKLVGLAVILFLPMGLYVHRSTSNSEGFWRRLRAAALGTLLGGAIGVVTFVILDPYSVIDWWRFLSDMVAQALMARGYPAYVFTLQYSGTLPYLYPIWQNVTRGWGIGVGLLLWAGLIWSVIKLIRQRFRFDAWTLLAVWALVFFTVIGAWHTKFPRYLLPIMLLLAVLAVGMLAQAFQWLKPRAARFALGGVVAVLFVMTALYATAIDGVFAQAHPWISASRWIYDHVPVGSRIATEYWDMALPLPLTDGTRQLRASVYSSTELDLYPEDTLKKWQDLAQTLASTDVLVVATPRVYGPIGLLKDQYPRTYRFYQLLFHGDLGFRLADWEANDPQLFGLTLVEDPFVRANLIPPDAIAAAWDQTGAVLLANGDESWTVYDRPLTMVFQNDARLSADQLLRLVESPAP